MSNSKICAIPVQFRFATTTARLAYTANAFDPMCVPAKSDGKAICATRAFLSPVAFMDLAIARSNAIVRPMLTAFYCGRELFAINLLAPTVMPDMDNASSLWCAHVTMGGKVTSARLVSNFLDA